MSLHPASMEQAADGHWFFKQNNDGVFVKVNDERVKNKHGNLMEQVLDVKELQSKSREHTHYVAASFTRDVPCCIKLQSYQSLHSFQSSIRRNIVLLYNV